jgi:putative Mg2+ transporter-C (MgtC) family protein
MELLDVTLRLAAATIAGGLLGINRDLHAKPTGVRTLGLVGLGSALAVMAGAESSPEAATRVMQGIVTGIGFLGAGVILRHGNSQRIHGLTTAACTWLTACIGMVCAVAAWQIVAVGLVMAFAILVGGGPLEKWLRRHIVRAEAEPAAGGTKHMPPD